jgi:hypothetical protein
MAVRVLKFYKEAYPYSGVVLFADEKTDIVDGMVVEGLPDDFVIPWGSKAITADGEVGYLKSTGTWNWVGE